ncbi:MAG: hypothetical protein ACRERD_17675 [Candidatus Binatia bacterium]
MASHRLQIAVSSETNARNERVAKTKKTKPQRVILDALVYYLPLADPGLEAEFAEWDCLSDEALVR